MADYFVNEGNKIGYLETTFASSANNSLADMKIVAGADIKKGQVVYLSDSLTVQKTSAANNKVLGVAMFDAKDGEPVAVECEGLFKLTASAAITAPALVESAADGRVATAGATPTKVIGIALNDAAAAGDKVYVKFSI